MSCKYKSEFNLTAGESADKAPLNTLTSGTTPKARAFLLKGEGPKRPRAGSSREKTCRRTRARPLILTWEATVKAGRLERGAGPSVWAPDKPCGWELLGGVPCLGPPPPPPTAAGLRSQAHFDLKLTEADPHSQVLQFRLRGFSLNSTKTSDEPCDAIL